MKASTTSTNKAPKGKSTKAVKLVSSKPTQAQRDAALNASAPKLAPVTCYKTDYDALNEAAKAGQAEMVKGMYSLAVLIVAGMISVTKAGTITRKTGHSNMVAAMSKALHKKCRSGGNHKHAVLYASAPDIGSGGEQFQLNEAGQVFFHNRNVNSGPAFNTEAVHAIEAAKQIKKGGELFVPAIMAKPVKLQKCKPVKIAKC